MKNDDNERIVYSLNVEDIQEIANQILDRNLDKDEISLVERSLPGYIDWIQAVENSIREHFRK
jgi:hypothetical protein